MKLQLKNYQKKIVEFCKTTDKIILSVGMGLGKSAAVLHYIDEAKPKSLLIVATLSEITDITHLINACGGRLLMMKLEKLIFTQKG